MIKAFLKFAVPVSVAGVGGTSAFGALSNSQPQSVSSDSAIAPSVQEQVERELPKTQSEVSADSNSSQETISSGQQPQTEEPSVQTLVSEKTKATVELASEEHTGNCKVVNKKEITDKLPSEHKYVSFSCQNPSDNDEAVLINWNGFFPEVLLKGGLKAFPLDRQFSIRVSERDLDEDDPEDAVYETTFESKEFLTSTSTIVGRWSNQEVGDTGEETVYKVRLPENSSSVKYVYLTYS